MYSLNDKYLLLYKVNFQHLCIIKDIPQGHNVHMLNFLFAILLCCTLLIQMLINLAIQDMQILNVCYYIMP